MESSSFHSNQDNNILYSEKLFQILEKLDSIIESTKIQDNSEQFVLGVETSANVVRGAISGDLNKYLGSIAYPNQIPLI